MSRQHPVEEQETSDWLNRYSVPQVSVYVNKEIFRWKNMDKMSTTVSNKLVKTKYCHDQYVFKPLKPFVSNLSLYIKRKNVLMLNINS